MKYREIVAVTGLSGLYQLLTTKSDGAIVRNVADKSTKFIAARQHHVTPLESIEVYTTGENVRLHHVFQKMQEHEVAIPLADVKSADNNAIKGYFKSIFPEFDEERVYVSDMKKMLKWYDLLKANDLLHFEEEAAEETADEETPVAVAVVTETAPAETIEVAPDKEAIAPKAEEAATVEGEEKPKKTANLPAGRQGKKMEEAAAAEGEEKPKKTAKKKTPDA